MNVSTAIVLAVIVVCVCLAVRSFRKKGMCGCKEHCSCSGSCASGCSACALSEDAIREMQRGGRARRRFLKIFESRFTRAGRAVPCAFRPARSPEWRAGVVLW